MNQDTVKFALTSKRLTILVGALAALLCTIAVFELGVFVGFHKASFAHDWQESYDRNFGGNFGMGPMMYGPNPHGASGAIVSVSGNTFVISNPNEPEKTVSVGDDTIIRSGAGTLSLKDLRPGMAAIVLGEPAGSNGTIDARLVRILPGPNAPQQNATTTTK